MADGVTMETGASVVWHAELDSKSAPALAPIPLRLMVARNALDATKRPGHVTMDHAKVGEGMINLRYNVETEFLSPSLHLK